MDGVPQPVRCLLNECIKPHSRGRNSGKLVECGRHFARPDNSGKIKQLEQVLEDAKYYGAPPEQIKVLESQIAELKQEPAFEVWDENWQALEIFLELCSQWLISPHGGFLGLNGQVLLSYLALLDESKAAQRQLYKDVQLIASGAISAWREQSERQQPNDTDNDEADDDE
jgi:hypothetical protein